MPPREVSREHQLAAVVRAAVDLLVALGREVPPLCDSSIQADAVRIGHMEWVMAAFSRDLKARLAALPQEQRLAVAEALLCAAHEDPWVGDLPPGLPPRARNLRPASVGDEAFVHDLADKLIEVHETDTRPEGGAV